MQFILKMPDVGEGVTEAEIGEWEIAVGDEVLEDQHIADIMTDKVTVEITSPVTGTVTKLACAVGDTLAIGAPLVFFEVEGEEPETSNAALPDVTAQPTTGTENNGSSQIHAVSRGKFLASPAVRQRAKQAGIDLAGVSSGQNDGRIRHEDLDEYITKSRSPAAVSTAGGERLKGLRRVIARKMEFAARTIPHFNYTEEIELTQLDKHRDAINEHAKSPLGYLPFFMHALNQLLPKYPSINAHFNNEEQTTQRFSNINYGIATHTNQGLKVPVVHQAQDRTLADLDRELTRVVNKARDHRSSPDELSGSTITLSSLGKLGGIVASPIINYPEVAIVVFHKAELRAVVRDGEIVSRKMMNISGAFDHRVVDGHDAASLIGELKAMIEAK